MPDVSRLDPATLDIARNIGVYLHPFFRHPDTLNGVRPAKRVMTLPALAISAGRTSAAPAPSSCPSCTAIPHLEQQAGGCNAPVIMNLVCTHLTTICVRRALIAVGTILPWGLPPSFLLVSTRKPSPNSSAFALLVRAAMLRLFLARQKKTGTSAPICLPNSSERKASLSHMTGSSSRSLFD